MSGQTKEKRFFIGVDLSSTSVLAVAITETGEVAFQASSEFDLKKNNLPRGKSEQSVEVWWNSSCLAVGHLVSQLRKGGVKPNQLRGISVSSEPGHIAILNRGGGQLHPAIMDDDTRAVEQAARLNLIGQTYTKKIGVSFKPGHAISKIVWVKEHFPDIYENAIFVHQADYIVGLLKGHFAITSASLASTTGFDLFERCWPDWLDYDMHLSVRERLPILAETGTVIGNVSPESSKMTGLPVGLPIVLGCSTQTAAFIASGARRLGDFFTQFGNSLQINGITQKIMQYPHNIIKMNYLHGRECFFSTYSNTGTEWVETWFTEQAAHENVEVLDALLPTCYIAYPNVQKGEVFPFCSNSAEGFISPATDNRSIQFAACIQGTALFERLIYQTLDKLGENTTPGQIYTIGSYCDSDFWLQCRADVTERIIYRLESTQTPAFGTAMVAAMGTDFGSLQNVSDAMVRIEKTFFPNPVRVPAYKEHYRSFVTTMEEQGYLL